MIKAHIPNPKPMKILTIIGTRPQFIKAAVISRAIAAHNRLNPNAAHLTEIIIHTGQHYDDGMSSIFFRELEIPEPVYNLGIGSGMHGQQTGEMLIAIEKVLMAEQPDCVLVYGDTNSTLAGALAAAKMHINIAHVEAGLRSFNRKMPEEVNRIITDHLSGLLFCPSQTAVNNLAAEGIITSSLRNHHRSPIIANQYDVSVVGDVMADALEFAISRNSKHSDILNRQDLKRGKYLLATIHRSENTDNRQRLKNIMSAFDDLNETVVFPVHPRSKKILAEIKYMPPPHIKLLDPVGYFDMVALEQSARMIMTDSGGMQKEAYWLKVPCITLRNETEWIETVESGWNILTGSNQQKIINAVQHFTPPTDHPPLYGDSRVAEKIVGTLLERSLTNHE